MLFIKFSSILTKNSENCFHAVNILRALVICPYLEVASPIILPSVFESFQVTAKWICFRMILKQTIDVFIATDWRARAGNSTLVIDGDVRTLSTNIGMSANIIKYKEKK